MLEGPSVRLCLAIAMGDPDPRSIDYGFARVAEPDPRRPWKEPITDAIWRLEDEVPVPAHEPPDDAIREVVDRLAKSPPDLTAWWARAGEAAAELGPDAVDDLLAAILHPLPPADRSRLVDHVFLTQVAAVMLVARTETAWSGSRRREALLSLLHGPQDWVTAAAVLVLTEVALHEPRAFEEIRSELADLALHVPADGHVPFAEALGLAIDRLPFFPPGPAEEVRELLDAIFGPYDDQGPDPAGEAPPTPTPTTAEPRIGGWVWVTLAVVFVIALLRWATS
jgi:hypothetical protein